ncbi:TetR/AcrR family transcriptional regulator [Sphingobium sp.]|uniref:TetR/AcrR family transcriptional regulator n=1 Tax=Sphingobium sp. TaxID=1912891 RepID=UPI0035C6F1E7
MNDEPKRYHHGDLRRALLDTALEMLSRDDGWQFTLREVARRAGVSHTAAYKHFSDKADLLAELALVGFERLREALIAARPAEPESLRVAYLEMSAAYVQFGTANPNLYRLTFSNEARISANPRLKQRADAALQVLIDLFVGGQRAGWLRERDARAQANAAWAQLHGLVLLMIDGLLDEPIAAASLAIMLEGLEA